MCICPQQVWASGNTTSCPSRSSSATVAFPTAGNIASARHVTNSATRMSPPFFSRAPAAARAATGLADDQLGLEDDVPVLVPAVVLDLLEQQGSRRAAELFAGLPDGA